MRRAVLFATLSMFILLRGHAALGATCQATAADPAGWFALGDPALPLAAGDSAAQSIVLGFDEAGHPLAALVVPGVGLAAASMVGAGFHIEPLGVPDPLDIAVGADAQGALIAAVAANGKTVLFRRRDDKWQRRELSLFCHGSSWDVEFGAMKEWPVITVDGSGSLWQACIQRTFALGRVIVMPSGPPLRSVRLRLGRLVGTQWVETGLALPHGYGTALNLTSNRRGEPVVWLGNGEVVVPRLGPQRFGTPQLKRIPAAQRIVSATGAGWFYSSHSCEKEERCILSGSDAGAVESSAAEQLEMPVLPHALARRGETWIAALLGPLRLITGDGKTWKPYQGEAAPGISAAASRASDPAIALDDCGRPVVMWQGPGAQVLGRSWNGQGWAALAAMTGAGPYGLAVGKDGQVLVGSWSLGLKPSLEVRRVGPSTTAAAAAALPSLHLGGDEWRTLDIERTRLTVDATLHVALPIRDNALAAPHRIGFRLDGQTWRPEEVPASLVSAPAMPWGAQPEVAKRSALALDPRGRQIVTWVDGSALATAYWDGASWQPLERIDAGGVVGTPAIAATRERVCLAWVGPSGVFTEVFARCHRGVP